MNRMLGLVVKNRWLYFLAIPGAAYLLMYRYLPMYGTVLAFKRLRYSRGIMGSPWVGLDNFERFFGSPFFGLIIANTIIISLLKLFLAFPVPIILALMLNEVRVSIYKRTIQTILYLPHFISWVIIGHLAVVLLAPATGVLTNVVANTVGVHLNLLMDPRLFRGTLVLTEIWKEAGWGTIIYLAALAGIDPNLYEAAIIDGAQKRQQIWYITLPSIVPVIVVLFIYRVGYILDAGFEQIFIMQNAIVYQVSEIVDTYVYKVAFQQGRHGLATAVGLFKSVVGFFMVIGTNALVKRLGDEGLW